MRLPGILAPAAQYAPEVDRARDAYPRTRLTGAFERRVGATLHAHLAPDAPVVVACSGGPDSTATLIAVARVRSASVTAATFDHRMREGAETETEIVRRVSCDLDVGFLQGRATAALRGEDAARVARYRWLARACADAGAGTCLTGHTRDDQAETVLLRLARGAGARGVAGMADASSWPVSGRGTAGLRLLRPLLGVTRTEVEEYLGALGVVAARDPSNEALDYARNRVRQAVLPALTEVNGQARDHLSAFAERQREDDEALVLWARRWLGEHVEPDREGAVLPRRSLAALPKAVGCRVLMEAASGLGLRLGGRHLEAGWGLIAGAGEGAVTLTRGTLEVRGRVVRLGRRA